MVVCEHFNADHFAAAGAQFLDKLLRLVEPFGQLGVPFFGLDEIVHLKEGAGSDAMLYSTGANLIKSSLEQSIRRLSEAVVLVKHLPIHVYLLLPEELVRFHVDALLPLTIQHHETEKDFLVRGTVISDIVIDYEVFQGHKVVRIRAKTQRILTETIP